MAQGKTPQKELGDMKIRKSRVRRIADRNRDNAAAVGVGLIAAGIWTVGGIVVSAAAKALTKDEDNKDKEKKRVVVKAK